MARVLVVDDEDGIRRTVGLFLTAAGHEVDTAANVLQASGLISHREYDVILSDIVMPGDDGLQLLQLVRNRSPMTMFILITGEPTVETATEALRLGAFDYLPKPVRRDAVCQVVAKAAGERDLWMRNFRLQEESRRHGEELERQVVERTAELKAALYSLEKTLDSTTMALSMALEMRDPYTAGHQRRVTGLACAIWDRLSLPPGAREGLRIAGLLHDLGKIKVPAEILSKPSSLSTAELMLIREHPVSAGEILRLVQFSWPVAVIVRQHHERLDGSGYPDGLKGGDILTESYVLAVADTVEAMASHRPYRPSRGVDAALKEITSGRGTAYWPGAVDACLQLFREDHYTLSVAENPTGGDSGPDR